MRQCRLYGADTIMEKNLFAGALKIYFNSSAKTHNGFLANAAVFCADETANMCAPACYVRDPDSKCMSKNRIIEFKPMLNDKPAHQFAQFAGQCGQVFGVAVDLGAGIRHFLGLMIHFRDGF